MTDPQLQAALEIRFTSDAGHNITIREYLHRLLAAVWQEQESFSVKRPFGNSGWEYDLYVPLINAGVIKGKLDPDGYVEEVDPKADKFVLKLIRAAFYPEEAKK